MGLGRTRNLPVSVFWYVDNSLQRFTFENVKFYFFIIQNVDELLSVALRGSSLNPNVPKAENGPPHI